MDDAEYDSSDIIYDIPVLRLRSEPVLVIVRQPTDQSGRIGDTVTFRCLATSTSTVSYRWYYYTGSSWAQVYGGGHDYLTVTITEENIGQTYRCRCSDSDGHVVFSDSASIVYHEYYTLSETLSWLGSNLFTQLFNFTTPWGITFGALIVGVFGVPLLVKAYKKFF